MSRTPAYTPYRRALAWLGFITLYLGIPVFLGYSLSVYQHQRVPENIVPDEQTITSESTQN